MLITEVIYPCIYLANGLIVRTELPVHPPDCNCQSQFTLWTAKPVTVHRPDCTVGTTGGAEWNSRT